MTNKPTKNITKPQKKYTATDKKSLTAAERRYRSAVSKLRGIQRSSVQKDTQVDISYLIGKIEMYGFNFFPNHYIFDDIVALETIVNKLTSK